MYQCIHGFLYYVRQEGYGNIKKYITQKRGKESKRESNYDNFIVEFLQTSMTSV